MTAPSSSPNDSDSEKTSLSENLGGVAALLGIEIEEMDAERVTATMPVTPDHHQPFGLLHGGVSVVLAESVASVGGHLAAPSGHSAVGIEVNANHVRAMTSGVVTGEARPVHLGRSTQVWAVEIRRERDGKLVARGQVRFHVLDRLPSERAEARAGAGEDR